MGKLINFEFRKLFSHKSFYICLLVTAGLIVITSLTMKLLAGADYAPDWLNGMSGFYTDAMLTLILGIFTAIYVSEDAAGGTIKNIYARGFSRTQIYFSKYIVSSVSVLIFCAFDLAAEVICGIVMGGKAGETTSMFIPDLIGSILMILVINTVFFFISYITGKSGAGIAINIVISQIVGLILPLGDIALKLEKFSLSDFWVDGILRNAANAETVSVLSKNIAYGLVWFAIITIAGVYISNRQEV